MPRRNRLRFLVANTALLAVLPACVPPAPVTPPSPPPPAQFKQAGVKLFTGGLGLPAITGSKQATTGSAGTGSKGGASTSVTTAGTTPTTPATTSSSGGGGSSGGGTSGDAVVSLEGFLDQPTYVADSGDAVQVATEAELRAALADPDVANIELTADIDVMADAATLDLAIDRTVSIDGANHVLTASAMTITASGGITMQRLVIPNSVEAIGADFLRIMNSTLGGNDPAAAFIATGGDNLTLSSCDIVGGAVGAKARGGATLSLTSCDVDADIGATVNAAELTVEGGTFTNSGLGINVINGVLDVDFTTFAGTSNPAISVTANAAGTELSVDDASFTNGLTGVSISGTSAATVAVRTSTFTNNDVAIDFNYAFTTWSATLTGNNIFSNDATDVGVSTAAASGSSGLVDTWRSSNTFAVYEPGRDIIVQP